MKHAFHVVAAAALVLSDVICSALLVAQPTGNAGAASGEDKGGIAAEQMTLLRKEVEEVEAAYLRFHQERNAEKRDEAWLAYLTTADRNMPQIVALASKAPQASAAFEALTWVVVVGRQAAYKDWGTQAIKVLHAHHVTNPKIGSLCAALGRGYYWDEQHEEARALLRAAAKENPERDVRGVATYALARLLHQRSQALAFRRKGDPTPVLQEADALFETVVDRYSNLKLPDARSDRTLGELTKAELFEIRHLAVGKVAPDIEAEDVDGQRFKLSDYRGKVVVLDFWGHW